MEWTIYLFNFVLNRHNFLNIKSYGFFCNKLTKHLSICKKKVIKKQKQKTQQTETEKWLRKLHNRDVSRTNVYSYVKGKYVHYLISFCIDEFLHVCTQKKIRVNWKVPASWNL